MPTVNSLYALNEVRFQFTARPKNTFSPGDRLKKLFYRNGKPQEESLIPSESFILGPLSLNIAKGKLTSILGRSGSGKTTLLSLLGLLRRPLEGEIEINLHEGYRIAELWQNERRIEHFRAQNIGFALQRGELLPYLTLRENAEVILRFLGQQEPQIREAVESIFQNLFQGEMREGKFAEVIDSKPSNVSQGQYQRGSIVRALANSPSILLADEPTGNLDQLTGELAMRIFRQLVDETPAGAMPQTVIVVTHDLLLAMKFADEIIVLSNGKRRAHYTLDRQQKIWSEAEKSGSQFSHVELNKRLLSDLQN
jgi:putative ABC transport system ATP-binding protein